jgi:hypothetical protein
MWVERQYWRRLLESSVKEPSQDKGDSVEDCFLGEQSLSVGASRIDGSSGRNCTELKKKAGEG